MVSVVMDTGLACYCGQRDLLRRRAGEEDRTLELFPEPPGLELAGLFTAAGWQRHLGFAT